MALGQDTKVEQAGIAEMSLNGAIKELRASANRLDSLVFGERPQASEKVPQAGDIVTEMRNQVREVTNQIESCNKRLKLLR